MAVVPEPARHREGELVANYGGGVGQGSALRRSLLGGGQQRPIQGGINWGGQQFGDPASLVQWMNARGAGTSIEQFLGNHPGVAAQFGHRGAAPSGSPGHEALGAAPGYGIPEGPPAGVVPGNAQVNRGMPLGADPQAGLLARLGSLGPHAGLAAPLQRASLGQVSQRRIARRPLLQGHPAY